MELQKKATDNKKSTFIRFFIDLGEILIYNRRFKRKPILLMKILIIFSLESYS